MQWIQIDVATTTAGIEPLTAALSELGIDGFSIRDSADFAAFLAGKQGRWDYIDEELMALSGCESAVTFYLAENEQGRATLKAAKSLLERLRGEKNAQEYGRLAMTISTLKDEDWASSWKKYWAPAKVGKSLVVCPTWEEYDPQPGETVLRLDPGAAFGSGTHHSTRLCLELAEEHVRGGDRVLDLGCGSGILGIAALLLGAESARGVDIGQVAVEVAAQNAAQNGVEARCAFAVGDLANGVEGTFEIVFANIVADIIIRLAPDVPRLLADGGVLIASGIIEEREEEVVRAFQNAGLTVSGRRADGGWVALVGIRQDL